MNKFLKFFCKGILLLVGISSSLVYAYPPCFFSSANIVVPKGTKYKVGPNLAAAIANYPGVEQAILNGIAVWNESDFYTRGRLIESNGISTDDCPPGGTSGTPLPIGTSLQIGLYEFYGSNCLSATSNNLTGPIPSDLDKLPLGFVDFFTYYPCVTCTSRSVSLNANVVWSLNPSSTEVDVQSVMAHEIGHVFGIAHGERSSVYPLGSCVITLEKTEKCSENIDRETMANYIYRGETCVRSLNDHDKDNARAIP